MKCYRWWMINQDIIKSSKVKKDVPMTVFRCPRAIGMFEQMVMQSIFQWSIWLPQLPKTSKDISIPADSLSSLINHISFQRPPRTSAFPLIPRLHWLDRISFKRYLKTSASPLIPHLHWFDRIGFKRPQRTSTSTLILCWTSSCFLICSFSIKILPTCSPL